MRERYLTLVCDRGHPTTRTWRLGESPVIVGSAPGAHVHIEDPRLQRRQFTIEYDARLDRHHVVDWVGPRGLRVDRRDGDQLLTDGSVIRTKSQLFVYSDVSAWVPEGFDLLPAGERSALDRLLARRLDDYEEQCRNGNPRPLVLCGPMDAGWFSTERRHDSIHSGRRVLIDGCAITPKIFEDRRPVYLDLPYPVHDVDELTTQLFAALDERVLHVWYGAELHPVVQRRIVEYLEEHPTHPALITFKQSAAEVSEMASPLARYVRDLAPIECASLSRRTESLVYRLMTQLPAGLIHVSAAEDVLYGDWSNHDRAFNAFIDDLRNEFTSGIVQHHDVHRCFAYQKTPEPEQERYPPPPERVPIFPFYRFIAK